MKTILMALLPLWRPAAAQLSAPPATTAADTARLRQHLVYLTTTPQARSYLSPAVLDSVAA